MMTYTYKLQPFLYGLEHNYRLKKRKRAKGKMACSSSGINTMETQHMHGKQENRQGEHQR